MGKSQRPKGLGVKVRCPSCEWWVHYLNKDKKTCYVCKPPKEKNEK